MTTGQYKPRRVGTSYYGVYVREEGGDFYPVDFKTKEARRYWLANDKTHDYVGETYEIPKYADEE